jgi:hypothetical protein
MFLNFHSTLYAMADSMVIELCPNAKINSHSLNKVVLFLVEQHSRMPDYLPFPFKYSVILFGAWAIPFSGRPYHKLAHIRRWRQIQVWKNSSLAFRRDLIRFLEALIVFYWYSELLDIKMSEKARISIS